MSAVWYDIKSGSVHHTHSELESRLRNYFEMSPFVLECRTQYPSWSRDEYLQYWAQGKPFPMTRVMAIDFMLTLQIPGIPYPLYHGVSAKPRELQGVPESRRRHQREESALAAWAATHEVMDEFTIPDQEARNHVEMREWFKHTAISEHKEAAFAQARLMKTFSDTKGPLDSVLGKMGQHFGYPLQQAYRLFGIGLFLGYIQVDHAHPLSPGEKLHLR